MAFQQTVNITLALGVIGEVFDTGPIRSKPYNLVSDPNPNTVGRAFTVTEGADPTPVSGGVTSSANAGTARAGGTGVFAGILGNPKEYASFGVTGNPLGATLTLPDYAIGTLFTMAEMVVTLPVAANVGDLVYYDNSTGVLGSIAPTASFTGVITSETGGDVLTVSAIVAGSNIGLGSVISGAGIPVGTRVTALGTGTGGNGTYILSTINLLDVSSEAMTATAVAPTDKTLVPNCVVDRYDTTGAGLAVIKLTN